MGRNESKQDATAVLYPLRSNEKGGKLAKRNHLVVTKTRDRK